MISLGGDLCFIYLIANAITIIIARLYNDFIDISKKVGKFVIMMAKILVKKKNRFKVGV